MMVTMVLALTMGQTNYDADAAAAIAIAKAQAAKTVKEQPNGKQPDAITKTPTYTEVRDRAYEDRTPLVVFVGVPTRRVTGAAVYGVEAGVGGGFDEYPSRCIIVSYPTGEWRATLRADATDAEIAAAVEGRVSRSAAPFRRLRRGEVRAAADDDLGIPQLRDLLKGMERYESAKNTQTTFRRWSGYISPSLRTSLDNKWQVPGHLDGVEGWSSTLYKTKGIRAREFLVRQDPSDGSSAVTWDRSYPDGTEFVDVLRGKSGAVFEVRIAEKQGGVWDRYIAYNNAEERPNGYVRPKSNDCRSCHEGSQRPGIAAYGGAAIPGGDSIFSDPIIALEYGGIIQGGHGIRLGN